MKCDKCGQDIVSVLCHTFTWEGADSDIDLPILGGEEEGECFYITAPKSATMFEFEDCYEEFKDFIYCPKCHKYPFEDKSISVYEKADVVFGISDEQDFA